MKTEKTYGFFAEKVDEYHVSWTEGAGAFSNEGAVVEFTVPTMENHRLSYIRVLPGFTGKVFLGYCLYDGKACLLEGVYTKEKGLNYGEVMYFAMVVCENGKIIGVRNKFF